MERWHGLGLCLLVFHANAEFMEYWKLQMTFACTLTRAAFNDQAEVRTNLLSSKQSRDVYGKSKERLKQRRHGEQSKHS